MLIGNGEAACFFPLVNVYSIHICRIEGGSNQEVAMRSKMKPMYWLLLLTVIIGFGQVFSLAVNAIR